jgi:hypothetical protein
MIIFSKNKISEEKRESMKSLYFSSKNKEKKRFENNLYERKERKGKYDMTNAVIYDLNNITYLIL